MTLSPIGESHVTGLDHDGHGEASTRDLYKTYGLWFRFYVTSDVSKTDGLNIFLVFALGFGFWSTVDFLFRCLAPCYSKPLTSERFEEAQYVVISEQNLEGSDNQVDTQEGEEEEAGAAREVRD